MITQKDLKRFRFMKIEAEDLRMRLNELEANFTSPLIPSYMEGSKTSLESDLMGFRVHKLDELRSRYKNKLNLIVLEQEKIEKWMESLGERERLMIRLIYFDSMTWENTAERLNISVVTIFNWHKKLFS